MGLFSRKHSGRNGNGGDHHNQNNGNLRLPANMKRADSNPAQNATLPDIQLPKAPDPNLDPAGYLRSIYAVRERSRYVLGKAKRNQLRHFTVEMSKFADTANYMVMTIKRDSDPDYSSIPPLGRWQHFEVGGRPRVDQLMATWPSAVDKMERTETHGPLPGVVPYLPSCSILGKDAIKIEEEPSSEVSASRPGSWSIHCDCTDQAPYFPAKDVGNMMTSTSLFGLPQNNGSAQLAFFLKTTGPHRRPTKVEEPKPDVDAPKKVLQFFKPRLKRSKKTWLGAHQT
ncbi:hypothetical protein LTR17_022022, partial [Elasticomyces elasticus]